MPAWAEAIDSLAAVPGYNVSLGAEDFLRILDASRLAHIGHSPNFAPADRTLWELRGRVEGAKEEPALIAASLLGKKLAAGAYCGSYRRARWASWERRAHGGSGAGDRLGDRERGALPGDAGFLRPVRRHPAALAAPHKMKEPTLRADLVQI